MMCVGAMEAEQAVGPWLENGGYLVGQVQVWMTRRMGKCSGGRGKAEKR